MASLTQIHLHGPAGKAYHQRCKTLTANHHSLTRQPAARNQTLCRFQNSQQPTTTSACAPVKLANEELQSLQAVLRAQQLPTDSTAVAVDQVPESVVQQMLDIISKGKEKITEDLQQLEGFMLLAEQLQKQQGLGAKGVVPMMNPQTVEVWQVGYSCGDQRSNWQSWCVSWCTSTEDHMDTVTATVLLCITSSTVTWQCIDDASCIADIQHCTICLHLCCVQPIFASSGGFPRLLYIPGVYQCSVAAVTATMISR